jgi:hypothetical protein
LLAGLLRCGHCGRRLHVAYSGSDGNTGRYHCRGGHFNHGGDRCISFGGMRIDRDVAAHVIDRLQPLGIEAALAAQEARHRETSDKRRQVELALEQARYEAARARRQYDAVDPDNRLVASELEKRWNERLMEVRAIEAELDRLTAAPSGALSPVDRERLMALGADLERAWNSPGVANETKKRIVRTLIDEIIVRVEENALDLVIRWHGSDHSALKVKKNRSGQHRWSAAADVVDLTRPCLRPTSRVAAVALVGLHFEPTARVESFVHSGGSGSAPRRIHTTVKQQAWLAKFCF